MPLWRTGCRRDLERGADGGPRATRVVVHDFAGHPFQAQLARHLASRSHYDVTHFYCSSFQTPHGDVGGADDGSGGGAGTYRSVGVQLRRPFAKYTAVKRAMQELEYGWRVARGVARARPEIVISANMPLLAMMVFHVAMALRRIPVIFWMQDVYSVAMEAHLRDRAGLPGRVVAFVLRGVEKWGCRSSSRVVVISADFLDVLADWGVADDRTEVVQNWAPLDEVPAGQRPNAWSRKHGIEPADTVLLYAGTLGLKHEPSLLLQLARGFADDPAVRVIVASEGVGAAWLEREAAPHDHLELIPFQPYEELPDMLASADVLLVLLEPHAGTYSVPSKVLTYHCAGRPVLGAMPAHNLASEIITSTGSGVVVAPGDAEAFVSAARELVADPERRAEMGARARSYAEENFDIDHITDRFTGMIESVLGRRSTGRPIAC